MSTIEEIEWFAPAERLPDDEIFVLISDGAGNVTTGSTLDGAWLAYRECEFPADKGTCVATPAWWAHLPAGPEA